MDKNLSIIAISRITLPLEMERMNGEIRDREKNYERIKKCNSPILKGYQIFHNYIREHDGLNGTHQQKNVESKSKVMTNG